VRAPIEGWGGDARARAWRLFDVSENARARFVSLSLMRGDARVGVDERDVEGHCFLQVSGRKLR
jgi:hypothetical protein